MFSGGWPLEVKFTARCSVFNLMLPQRTDRSFWRQLGAARKRAARSHFSRTQPPPSVLPSGWHLQQLEPSPNAPHVGGCAPSDAPIHQLLLMGQGDINPPPESSPHGQSLPHALQVSYFERYRNAINWISLSPALVEARHPWSKLSFILQSPQVAFQSTGIHSSTQTSLSNTDRVTHPRS